MIQAIRYGGIAVYSPTCMSLWARGGGGGGGASTVCQSRAPPLKKSDRPC